MIFQYDSGPFISKAGLCLKFRRLLATVMLYLLSIGLADAQTTEILFDIYYKNKVIGIVTALKVQTGNKIIEDLHTKTDTKVLMMEMTVESEIKVTYTKNILTKGTAYRRSNRGQEDIQATTVKTAENLYTVERDQKKQSLRTDNIDFCVIDLYFTEPVGKTRIYSNMYGQFINISDEGRGRYKTILPDGKSAIYVYEAGKLETIEVQIALGKVVTKRRK